MKQRLTSLSVFEQALLQNRSIVMLFSSDLCYGCAAFEERLSEAMKQYPDSLYFECKRGDLPGLEKTFHLVRTPSLVLVSKEKYIHCERNCEAMNDETLLQLLEDMHERNRSLFL